MLILLCSHMRKVKIYVVYNAYHALMRRGYTTMIDKVDDELPFLGPDTDGG